MFASGEKREVFIQSHFYPNAHTLIQGVLILISGVLRMQNA